MREVYAQPSGDLGEGGAGLDWRRLLAAFLRYKWLIVALTALGTGGGIVASRFVKPTYITNATILVPVRGSGTGNGPIQPDVLFQSGGWTELIKTSFIVLDDVVRDLRLYLAVEGTRDSAFATFGIKPRFYPGQYALQVDATGQRYQLRTAEGSLVESGVVGDSIGAGVGFAWVPPDGTLRAGRTLKFSVVAPRDVARRLQRDLNARINEKGANILALSLEGQDPQRITATLNGIARGFVDSASALSLAKHRELVHTLKLQLDSADRHLRESEIAYETYRVGTYTLPRERATPIAPGVEGTTNPALDNYTKMKTELDGLERDHEAIEGVLDAAAADSGIAPDELAYVPAVQQSQDLKSALNTLTQQQSDLTALRLKYTDANPEVQRAVRDVEEMRTRTIPDLARGLLSQLSSRQRDLESRIEAAGRELRQVPRRATEEQRLQRQVGLAAFQYQNLEKQYQDALYALAAQDLGARVLDSAIVPTRPLTDTALSVAGMGILMGLGLGLAFAFLLDRMDRRVRYPEQVSTGLGLPILGAIPRVRPASNGRPLGPGDAAQVLEALRGIRLGLLHAHAASGPLMVTVTSPGPGEGKSFVVSNLALAFADAGHRTILIDGDVRRGELHKLLGTQRKPGLTDYLNGSATQDEIMQHTRYGSLSFVGGGVRTHAAPELLSSPKFSQLLLSLRGTYDVVLVDSPPLGAGVDPYVLGSATGSIVVVMRTGVTDRELAEAKLDMLDRMPVRILGAILNDVQPGGSYRYYGYQYYIDGYETQEEGAEEATPALKAPKA